MSFVKEPRARLNRILHLARRVNWLRLRGYPLLRVSSLSHQSLDNHSIVSRSRIYKQIGQSSIIILVHVTRCGEARQWESLQRRVQSKGQKNCGWQMKRVAFGVFSDARLLELLGSPRVAPPSCGLLCPCEKVSYKFE